MIKNKLKIGLLAGGLALLTMAIPVFAADLNFTDNATISINSHNYTILAGALATSIAISTNNLSLTVITGTDGTVGLISYDGYVLNSDIGLTQNCSGGHNSITVPASTTAVITPSATACGSGGGGGIVSSGGGGGGGGGTSNPTPVIAQSSTPVTITISPTVTMTTTSPGCSGGNKYDTSNGHLCVNSTIAVIAGCDGRNTGFSTTVGGQSCIGNSVNVNVTVTNSNGITTTYALGTVLLKNGSRGAAAKELQRFLNDKLNLGLVLDGIIGPKTIAVIKTWQKNHGLVADGLVGPKTKAMMNSGQ